VTRITSDDLDHFRSYTWPGNIYELHNVINHSAIRCHGDTLEVFHIPEYLFHESERTKARHTTVNAGFQH